MRTVCAATLVAIAFPISFSVSAQQPAGPSARGATAPSVRTPAVLARVTSAITLDGKSDDAAWSSVGPIEPVMLLPTFEGQPTQRTEFRFAYDASYFYASARMYVSSPDDIRGNSLQRDRLGSDDVFRIILDTFDDSESGVGFATTPTGVRVDFSVAADGQSINYDWNTMWDVATARTDSGWFAEMRIPLSSLRFQTQNGVATMGILAVRSSSATNETVTYPAASPRFANSSYRVSLGQRIVFDGVSSQRLFVATPYVLGGGTQTAVLDATGARYVSRKSDTREIGGDLKLGLTSNLTLDLTLNTDFAQAEVDDQQVNLTRFGLFFPEKRQFFLERAGVFDFSTGGFGDPSRLFHSRQIGLDNRGLPIRILGGGRLVGRVGGWDLASLDLETEGSRRGPAENFGVMRVRRRVLNSASTVGGIFTSRVAEAGKYNYSYGTDAVLRLLSNDYLTLQWAQTIDDSLGGSGASGMARAVWERRAAQGLVYRLGAKWSGADHDPELGFSTRRDFQAYEGNLRYGWYPGARTIFQNIQPSLLAYTVVRNTDGVAETVQVSSFLNFAFKSGVGGFLFHGFSSEYLNRTLQLAPNVTVPAGRHTFRSTSINVSPRQGARLRTSMSLGYGDFYDGKQFTALVAPTATVSPNLELSAEYQFNRIRFPSRSQSLEADIARLRAQVALNTKLSASGFVQYNRAADAIVSNVRVRLHLNEGRDLFVVYNDQLNTERDRVVPDLPLSQARAILVKFTYAVWM
jgi:hypothetical protein